MGDHDDELVGRFIARARERVGSEQALAELAGRLDRRDYSRQAVNNWVHGRADPPARLVLSIARELRISLDEFLMPDEERQTLEEKVEEMRRQLVIVKNELDRQRAVRGEPPLEYPEAIESA